MLILIEIFSYILRSFSLAIRLAANIMAGHTLVYIISSFILVLGTLNVFLAFLGIIVLVPILILELGVAFLQAYVFVILVSIIYMIHYIVAVTNYDGRYNLFNDFTWRSRKDPILFTII